MTDFISEICNDLCRALTKYDEENSEEQDKGFTLYTNVEDVANKLVKKIIEVRHAKT